MKRIDHITDNLVLLSVVGRSDITVESVTSDSRMAGPGVLFVATRGTKYDGHDFIHEAITAGSSVIVCEDIPHNRLPGVTYIQVADSAEALGVISSEFYDRPSESIRVVGVTGTNGKTTVVTLLYELFTRLGYKCGLISTVCNRIAGRELPATHTTPGQVELNRLMAEMRDSGCEYLFMEVSSHAVVQKRIAGIRYRGAVFTNLTHDHLDYHGSFANYLAAKKSFFDSLSKEAFALVNSDDRNGAVMLQNTPARHYSFSIKRGANYRCRIMELSMESMVLDFDGEQLWTPLTGSYNASNLLALYGTAMLLGADRQEVLVAMSTLKPVPGRLEIVFRGGGRTAIADYAHTPDALKNVTDNINDIRKGEGRLITVVGAGGDRDRTKRAEMALIAARTSDRVILTSDNPRSEDPERIIDDMEAGLDNEMRSRVIRIAGRRDAIRSAVMMSQPGDVILVAGKGHETYQEIKGVRHHFDDREELIAAFGTEQFK